ncbi:MAG: PilT/PilU family type 4a pilus ATPase [Proteobacteria bacterium]|nr:PilT/PilU family type 4a pilus ATPase [Pseudomonadota bacterium]
MKKVNLTEIVEKGISQGVKSIFFFKDLPPLGNNRNIIKLNDVVLGSEEINSLLKTTATAWQYETFEGKKELDYSYEINGLGRFRINAFLRMGNIGLVMRPIPNKVPSFSALGLPEILKKLTKKQNGLVLITGPTGSGKSTTLASLIDLINKERACHIVTIEDPIEFVYKSEKSIISQREVGKDTKSFQSALKRVLREDPDVILVGEIRDSETMKIVIEMAETGHLVFSTLHTINVVQTLNRIIDFFPEYEKNQIRNQLSQLLQCVVSQRLVQRADGKGFVCACEVMTTTQSIKTLIKEDKVHQIFSIMDISKKDDMISMDKSLLKLYENGLIDMPEMIFESSKEKGFIERIFETTPNKNQTLTGIRPLKLEKEMILYEADFSLNNLSFFDASGMLFDTPIGLLFRDRGPLKEDLNFIADYTILNGKKNIFSLKSFCNLSYKILETKVEKAWYLFRLRMVSDNNEDIEIPKIPLELIKDNEWHTLTIPVSKVYSGKTVKCYMLLFDNDIKEIAFNNIFFV